MSKLGNIATNIVRAIGSILFAIVFVAGLLFLAGLGRFAWKAMNGSNAGSEMKSDYVNPNDYKYLHYYLDNGEYIIMEKTKEHGFNTCNLDGPEELYYAETNGFKHVLYANRLYSVPLKDKTTEE